MQSRKSARGRAKEQPVFVVRSTRMGGLDYLHISLLVLVAVLIGLAFALAYFQPGIMLKDCPYGVLNDTCAPAPYNASQVMSAVGRVLDGYARSNSSLSLLAYYSMPNRTSFSYSADTGEWVAIVPYVDPFYNNETLNATFVLSNTLALKQSFLSMVNPARPGNDTVVAFGTIALSGKSLCAYRQPIPVYFISDPYVPGFVGYLNGAVNMSRKYAGRVNMSYYFIASQYAASKYAQYGAGTTQNLLRYLACASSQSGFGRFVSNLSIGYTGNPLSNSTLHDMVLGSGLNSTRFSACLANVSSALVAQSTLASFYNVQSVPAYIVDCRYGSIPDVVGGAINYTLNEVK